MEASTAFCTEPAITMRVKQDLNMPTTRSPSGDLGQATPSF